jgi:hypothetical protein
MRDDDWLEEPAFSYPTAKPDEGDPADASLPGLPLGRQAIVAAATAQELRGQFVTAWGELSDDQRIWLNTWRESRFNADRARRILAGTAVPTSKTTLSRWRELIGFELVENMLRSASTEEILSRDAVANRFEDIAVTALTPTAVLHQGVATGHFEVELGAANKANEMLAKLGGHLKDDSTNVSVAVGFVPMSVEIAAPAGADSVAAAPVIEASVQLPDEDWLA